MELWFALQALVEADRKKVEVAQLNSEVGASSVIG